MPDICDSREGEQPFYLLESTLEMDFSKAKERSVFFSGLEADEVISGLTQPCATPEVIARSHGLAAHMVVFFSEEERCHFSIPFASPKQLLYPQTIAGWPGLNSSVPKIASPSVERGWWAGGWESA